jgi:hypothetical protein
MGLFHIIDDSFAITHSKGVYKQCCLYHRDNALYAKNGAGFVRLMRSNDTSVPHIRWCEIFFDGKYREDKMGRLEVAKWPSSK